MPFLDHLEELRKRILLSAGGIVAGLGLGWWITNHFDMIHRLEAPIVPFLPGGKLMVTTPISPFMIVLKFALMFGLVLSSPWVLYQLWLFLAPALTSREKKAIVPALGFGLVLFLAGAATGWFLVLQPTVRWLLQFHSGDFLTQITYDSYLELVIHLLVAMGISAELPLVMILLASLGVMSYRRYTAWRRYSIFLCLLGGAVLSPVPEVISMLLFTIPLVLLYEVGVAGAYLIEKRKSHAAQAIAAGVLFLLLAGMPRQLHAQNPPIPGAQGPPVAGDTTHRNVTGQGLRSIDSSAAKRLGIPSAPTRTFPAPDSLMQRLLDRPDFAATRFLADSASFIVDSQQVMLSGHAATSRDKSQLEADRIIDDDARCLVQAQGEPRMFEPGHAALIGVTMQFNSCSDQGTIGTALTTLPAQGSNWFVRGNLEEQAGGKIVYAASSAFTSCDLPDPHYHFTAREVKWESGANGVIVARPAVLYIRDVPVAWLPFIFQPTKTGRSSGILIPHFGFNDIVRPTSTYNRSITNIGYYWAPNNYIDATGALDWVANHYVTYRGTFNYRWLNRFVQGGITLSDQIQSNGDDNKTIDWQHSQSFNTTTKIAVNFNYASSSSVLLNNAVDPLISTQSIRSDVSFDKRFSWGTFSAGGSRSQSVGQGATTTTFPNITLTPNAFSFGRHITWTPNFSLTSTTTSTLPETPLAELLTSGIDTVLSPNQSRATRVSLNSQFVLFGLQLTDNLEYDDSRFAGVKLVQQRVPDTSTPDPDDSVNVTTYRNGDYLSGVTVSPSIALPILFRGSWKVTPTVGVSTVTAGPLVIRSPGSNGQWVSQGFKLAVGLQSAPTFFGFINKGLGSYTRFRYTLSPVFGLNWSPAASVSPEFAKALGSVGGASLTDIPAQLQASVTLHQVFEGKLRPAAGDTNQDPIHLASLPKRQLLSISTSAISYDFEQAKLPGRSGWANTGQLQNSFSSDLLQGFTLSTTHQLFAGDPGSDTARFSPFLSNVQANFQFTGRTLRSLAAMFGLAHHDTVTAATPSALASAPLVAASSLSMLSSPTGMPTPLAHTGLSASVQFQLTRYRSIPVVEPPISTEPTDPSSTTDPFNDIPVVPIVAPPASSQLGLTLAFSPTPFWTVTWNTQYDFRLHSFQSQVVQLQRDLHDWRASFNFTKGPTGNFSLYFMVYLLSLPDIKFDYNQTTLQQATSQP